MWSLQQLCCVHPELYTWSCWVRAVREHCGCCDSCRLLLAVPWVAQLAGTSPHNATFTHALTLACLQERTGRPCLNRMHLVCLPAQGQGQLATWLPCQSGLTYGLACHCYNKRSTVALCVQERGHILLEYLQYAPLDTLCSWIELNGEALTKTHLSRVRIFCILCYILAFNHTCKAISIKSCLVDLLRGPSMLIPGSQFSSSDAAAVALQDSHFKIILIYLSIWAFCSPLLSETSSFTSSFPYGRPRFKQTFFWLAASCKQKLWAGGGLLTARAATETIILGITVEPRFKIWASNSHTV